MRERSTIREPLANHFTADASCIFATRACNLAIRTADNGNDGAAEISRDRARFFPPNRYGLHLATLTQSMKISPTIVPISCAAILLSAASVRADSLILNAANDTTLFATSAGNNLGGTTNFVVGTTATGAPNRGLLRFDIAGQIPANATINSASLVLFDSSSGSGFTASTFGLYRLLVGWGEGNKIGNNGQPATAGEATWVYSFYTNTSWSTPGAAAGVDFVSTPSATNFISVAGVTNTWSSTPTLVSDVQSWLDNTGTNFGWIIVSDGEFSAQTARRFSSRENLQGRGPKLFVDYTAAPVPEPATITLAILGGAMLLLKSARRHSHGTKK